MADSGVTPDGGAEPDSGVTPDSGVEPDSGVIPGPLELAMPREAVRTSSTTFRLPFDSVPSPNGTDFFFIAVTPDGPAVMKALMSGMGTPTVVHVGDPLVSPSGIDISTDGMTLYVADPAGRINADEDGDKGAVFSLSAAGGTPSVLSGTEGLRAQGVVVVRRGASDEVYFTTRTSVQKHAGMVSVVAMGDPFEGLSGVAVTAAGVVYAADTGGTVYSVTGGTVDVLVTGLRTGFPAGIAPTHDESTLIVSGLDVDSGHDVLYLVKLSDKSVTTFNDGISEFVESAGLHRAHGSDTFTWADSLQGKVFVVTKKP